MHHLTRAAFAGAVALTVVSPPGAIAADRPIVSTHDGFVNVVRVENGDVWRVRAFPSGNGGNGTIRYQVAQYDSEGNWDGKSWGANQDLVTASGHYIVSGVNPIPLLVKQTDGSYDLNFSRFTDLDLWYYRDNGSGELLSQMIYDGERVQHHMMMQTLGGRILIPFVDLNGEPSGPPYGRFSVRIAYSDNRGVSWAMSSSELEAPVPADFNGAGNGAVEPSIVQLGGSELWMLMTTQTGRHYQSFSSNQGATWSTPEETDFYCTTGWARVLRLDDWEGNSSSDPYDAPLVMMWTNATMPLKHNGDWWYSGRDTLHAAISLDNGETWEGYREIYRDPTRNEPSPGGDAGAALPFPTVTKDNRILLKTGQSTGTAMVYFDPAWLLAKTQSATFTINEESEEPYDLDPLYDWSVFKHYGVVGTQTDTNPGNGIPRNKRQRIASAAVVQDPEDSGNSVLRVRRAQKLADDGKTVLEPGDTGYSDVTNTLLDGDGAVWNFPMAKRARTELKLYLNDGFGGGLIAFTDRFFNPTDNQVEDDGLAFFTLDFDDTGELTGGHDLALDTWHDITLDWSVTQRKAIVYANGEQVGVVSTPTGIDALPGLSYLRFRSTAAGLDTGGFLVDDVYHVGEGIGDTVRLTSTEASDVLVSPPTGWTAIRFDDYVPNDLVTGGNPSGNGVIDGFSGTFNGFTDPTTAADPVGIVVESSTGTVTFSDNTSAQITSDLRGPSDGESLLIRFVDPDDIGVAAAVAGVAWRFGSVNADDVTVILYDAEGNVLPDWQFAAMPSGVSGQTGYLGLIDGESAAVIHAIEFIGDSSDVWLIGSFNQSTALNDFAFTGFTILEASTPPLIPEPGAWLVVGASLLMCGARRGRRLD